MKPITELRRTLIRFLEVLENPGDFTGSKTMSVTFTLSQAIHLAKRKGACFKRIPLEAVEPMIIKTVEEHFSGVRCRVSEFHCDGNDWQIFIEGVES